MNVEKFTKTIAITIAMVVDSNINDTKDELEICVNKLKNSTEAKLGREIDKNSTEAKLGREIDKNSTEAKLGREIDKNSTEAKLGREIDKNSTEAKLGREIDKNSTEAKLGREIDKNSTEAKLGREIDKNSTEAKLGREIDKNDPKSYDYEEALVITGNGRYNVSLLLVLSLTLMSMGMDMFGFSVVVTGCSCEFHLTQAQKGILSSMPFIGPILMSYTWGYVSDTQGRRRSLLIATTLAFIFSALSTLSPNWIVLAVLKLLATSLSSCAQSATYTLLGESCGQKTRGTYMLLMSSILHTTPIFYFTVGYFTLNLDFAYDLGFLGQYTAWRLFALILSIPLALSPLLLLAFYESPKFLANMGREAEALVVLRNIWIRNGGDPDKYPVKKLILDEQSSKRPDVSVLQSMWEQTVPLFKPPLLIKTLQLYFITAVIYGSSNSFIVWFPFITNEFFRSLKTSAGAGTISFCDMLNSDSSVAMRAGNVTEVLVEACSSRLEDFTVFTGIGLGISYGCVNLCIARAASRKKILTTVILLLSALGAVAVVSTPEPISAIVFYLVFTSSGLGIGLVSSYFVDLFPTSYRGMAACLSVIVARSSTLTGINLVGAYIHLHCKTTFMLAGAFVCCGVVVACFLPSDRPKKKSKS